MKTRLIQITALLCLLCVTAGMFILPFPWLVPVFAMVVPNTDVETNQQKTLTTQTQLTVDPIPGGCPGGLPGETPPVCCISGFVYLDGQPIAGAEIEIANTEGKIGRTQTYIHNGREKRPHYRLASLNASFLNVEPGDRITITARYNGQEYSINNYQVQPGGQQVDLVLARQQTNDNKFEPWLFGKAEPEKFNSPLGIASDRAGNIYVVDTANARVQVFTPSGQFLRQWGSVGNEPGRFRSPTGIAIDQNDNVYVVDQSNYRIQKFSSDGNWLTAWGTWGRNNGEFDEPYDVAIDRNNNIYVTDSRNDRIQQFDSKGNFLSTWGRFGTGQGEFKFPRGIAFDNENNVYVADTDNSRIQKFDSTGRFLLEFGTPGVSAGQLGNPFDLAVDTQANVYVADRLNSRVQKFTKEGVPILDWGSRGNGESEFNNLRGIAVDAVNNVYVADTFNDRIQKFDAMGNFLTAWGTRGLTNKVFNDPQGLAIDASYNVYVADTFNDRIQKFDSAGNFLTAWGKLGQADGEFYGPRGVAIDNIGQLYIVDRLRHRVQVFDSNGNFLKKWGNPSNQASSNNGEFKYPWGIAFDNNGNIYVTDSENYRVQKFDSAGNFVSTWGTVGNANGQFNLPRGIAIDSNNHVYVADRNNHRIQKFNADGTFVAVLGTSGNEEGQFAYPDGVRVDNQDNLYVVDTENHRIQKFDPNGNFIFAWGKKGNPQGGFLYPRDMFIGNDGTLYVADSGSSRILRSQPFLFTRPIATINHVSANATSLSPDATLIIQGRGQSSDATRSIVSYQWTSDKNGLLGNSATLTYAANRLSSGTHHISLQVTDDKGEQSETVSTFIYVTEPADTQWTMLLYLVGDYNDDGKLMEDFAAVLNKLRTSFNNSNVRIAVQLDGPASIGTNIQDTRRLLIVPGTPPQVIEPTFNEQAMDAPNTLTDFIRWGQKSLPAKHYYLAIADHGQAIQGIGWDITSPSPENYLTVEDIATALQSADIAPLDILHLDGCSMSLFDVAYELRNKVHYLIAPQNLAWSYFAYDQYATGITSTTKPEELAKLVVTQYAQLARSDHLPFTLTALDLTRAEHVKTGINNLGQSLDAWVKADSSDVVRRQSVLKRIRSYGQKFNSNQDFINNDLDAYVDLLDWVTVLSSDSEAQLTQQIRNDAEALMRELNGLNGISPFILENQASSGILPADKLPIETRKQYPHGALVDLARANGISLYYPVSTTFSVGDVQTSRAQSVPRFDTAYDNYINERIFEFTLVSRWNEFLKTTVGIPLPGEPLGLPPGPLPILDPSHSVFLPLIKR